MTNHDRINDDAAAMLLAPARAEALRRCIDVLLRMIPEAQEKHALTEIFTDEHDEVIAIACTALYGEDRTKWPPGAQQAAEGEYE